MIWKEDLNLKKDLIASADIIQKWQGIVSTMAKIIGVPVGLIMRVDLPYIEVYKSNDNPKNPYIVGEKEVLELSGLYCETVIKTRDKLLVPNALIDKDWDKNPDIKLGMISYLGLPLLWPDDEIFGTLCVLDSKENKYSKDYEDLMFQLKQLIETHLALLCRELEVEKSLIEIKKRKKVEHELRKSKRKYREAYNRAELYKDIFAHDINNILQSVLLGIELYEVLSTDYKKIGEIKEIIEKIRSELNRASNLVSNIYKFSQIEVNQIPYNNIEILSLIKTIINRIEISFPDRVINVVIDSISEKINVQSNELLEDVFENLLLNAIKHNKNKTIKIVVRISSGPIDEKKYLKLEFIDNGMGIDDNRKNKLFLRGSVKDKCLYRRGLGLTLVRRIIDTYNGKIWVEDKVKGDYSKGSNFILLIPEVI